MKNFQRGKISRDGSGSFVVAADEAGNVNISLPQARWEVTFGEHGLLTRVQFLISYDDLEQLEAILKMGFKEGFTMTLAELDVLLPSLDAA